MTLPNYIQDEIDDHQIEQKDPERQARLNERLNSVQHLKNKQRVPEGMKLYTNTEIEHGYHTRDGQRLIPPEWGKAMIRQFYNPNKSYFAQDPKRLAKYKSFIDAAPADWQPPEWMNVNAINQAYNFMSEVQGGEWDQWQPFDVDDPNAVYLNMLGDPPKEFQLGYEDDFGKEFYNKVIDPKPVEQPQVEPDLLSEYGDWDELEGWQKVIGSLVGNVPEEAPEISRQINSAMKGLMAAGVGKMAGATLIKGLVMAGVGGTAGTAVAPVVGTAVGAVLGLGLGFASYQQSMTGKKIPVINEILYVADAMDVLFERIIGTSYQLVDADKDERIEILQNLPAAWKAAEMTYEVLPVGNWITNAISEYSYAAQLGLGQLGIDVDWSTGQKAKVGEIWQIQRGFAEPMMLRGGVMGGQALDEARLRIANKEDPELVYADFVDRFGYGGSLADFVLQSASPGDALIPRATNVMGEFAGKVTGNPRLSAAFKANKGAYGVDILPWGAKELVTIATGKPTSGGLFDALGTYRNWLRLGYYPEGTKPTIDVTEVTPLGRQYPDMWDDVATEVGTIVQSGGNQDAVRSYIVKKLQDADIDITHQRIQETIDRTASEVHAIMQDPNTPIGDLAEVAKGELKQSLNWIEATSKTIKREYTPELRELKRWEKVFANITEEGEFAELQPWRPDPKAPALKNAIGYLTHLDPQSQAFAMLNLLHNNLGSIFQMSDGNPDMVMKLIESIAKQDVTQIGNMGEALIKSPASATIAATLKDYIRSGIHREKYGQYMATSMLRAKLNKIAELLNENPGRVIELLKENPDAVGLRLLNKVDQMTDTVLDDIAVQIQANQFNPFEMQGLFEPYMDRHPVPWSDQQFIADIIMSITNHADRFLAQRYGIKPDPWVIKASKTLKAYQSLWLLGLNINYLVNKKINTDITLAAQGVLGTMTPTQLDSFWDRWGATPNKVIDGLGGAKGGKISILKAKADDGSGKSKRFFTNLVKQSVDMLTGRKEVVQEDGTRRVELTRGTPESQDRIRKAGLDLENAIIQEGDLDAVMNKAARKLSKLGIFANISKELQAQSGRQAVTIGTMQMWNKLWKPGLGYKKMPANVELALRTINPRLPDMIYSLVNSGVNMDEITTQLYSTRKIMGIKGYVDEVSGKLYKNAPELMTEMLVKTGIYEELNQRLVNAKTPDDVDYIFSNIVGDIDSYVDAMIDGDIKVRREDVKNRITVENMAGAIPIWNELTDMYEQQRYTDMRENGATAEQVYHLKMQIVEAQQAGQDALVQDLWHQINYLWETRINEQKKQWEILNKYTEESYKGMLDALDKDDPNNQRFIAAVEALNKNWRKFYDDKTEIIKGGLVTKKNAGAEGYEIIESVMELYKIHTAEEIKIHTEMWEALAEFQEKTTGVPKDDLLAWGKQIMDVRAKMVAEIIKHRENLPNDPTEQLAAWNDFNDNILTPLITQRIHLTIEGAKEIFAKTGEMTLEFDYEKAKREVDTWYSEQIAELDARYQKILDGLEEAETQQDAIDYQAEVERIKKEKDKRLKALKKRSENPQTIKAPAGGTPGDMYAGLLMSEVYQAKLKPYLNMIKKMIHDDMVNNKEFNLAKIDPSVKAEVDKWVSTLSESMAGTKLAAVSHGEFQRNRAMLDYSERYGFDNILDIIFPYQFWFTRSMAEWGKRMIDRPSWFAMYARIQKMQERHEKDPKIPKRFEGHMRVAAPWLPDWMGNSLFIDPFKRIFPFSQFSQPFEQADMDYASIVSRAQSRIIELSEQGYFTRDEAKEIIEKKEGAYWEQAMAEAQAEATKDELAPMNLTSMMVTPAMWWTYPYHMIKGTPEKIPLLPTTRLGQAVRGIGGDGIIGMIGNLLATPEESIRRKFNLPVYGQWGEYYLDRTLANMAGDNTYSVDEIRMAMSERKGPAYQEAIKRVEQELALRMPGSQTALAIKEGKYGAIPRTLLTTLFPAGILSEGELHFAGLKDSHAAAWEKLNSGEDPNAINDWYEANPEYKARTALFDEPEERLRKFLRDQVWDKYYAMPEEQRYELPEILGNQFRESFLDSETRDFDSIDTETLAYWSRVMGGNVPDVDATQKVTGMSDFEIPTLPNATMEPGQVDSGYSSMPSPDFMQQYEAQRSQMFPNYKTLQDTYWSLPENQRSGFLQEYPELKNYWDWNKAYKIQHPQVGDYIDQRNAEYAKENPMDQAVRTYAQDMDPALRMSLLFTYYAGQDATGSAKAVLRQDWDKLGRPGMDFEDWLAKVLKGLVE